MDTTSNELLLLRDTDDAYYAVPRRVIERYRVPHEHHSTLERVLHLGYARRRALNLAREIRAGKAEPASGAPEQLPAVLGWFELEAS